MKKIHLFLGLLIISLLTSCAVPQKPYYQVYKAEGLGNLVKKDNAYTFEDENCIISYNLWKNGGDIGFEIYNKRDENIYLNLEECFFVLNGIAHNYYKNRIFTFSKSQGIANARSSKSSSIYNSPSLSNLVYNASINSIGLSSSSGSSTAYNEEKIVCIPPKTSKSVREYAISDYTYRAADLFFFPRMKQVQPKRFLVTNSPFVFGNMLAFSTEKDKSLIRVENNFYVSEITNYPDFALTELKLEEYFGQKGTSYIKQFKSTPPDKFYFTYYRGGQIWKH
jgi:hypothetical protein